MAKKTYKKQITFTVSPTVILLAILILCIAWTLAKRSREEKKTLQIAQTATLVDRIKTLGELTTACYYDELVLQESKKNALSYTPLGVLARESLGQDIDDHLVIIAKGTVRAGVDFLEMSPEDLRFDGDTVFVRLPQARYLDVIINPSDFEIFAESGTWSHDQVTRLEQSAQDKLIHGADHYGLKTKAYEGAMDAVTTLLEASGYTFVRFDHRPSYIKLPPLAD